ncbi:hypothetical protein [Haloferax volcanii]|uniref:hypothetical protein n=1 Tax=Haloferax volcanii TaxID=2246 RepID=UPI00349F8861
MPRIRGYYFFGLGDTFTHLGWTYDIVDGSVDPAEFRYPLFHLLAVSISSIASISLRESLSLAALLFPVLFIITIPAIVKSGYGRYGGTIGLLCAATYPPLVHVGTGQLVPQPAAQSIFYFAIVVYAGYQSINSGKREWILIFFILNTGLVLLHPQRAINFVIFYAGALAAVVIRELLLYRSLRSTSRRNIIQTILVGLISYIWVIDKFEKAITLYMLRLVSLSSSTSRRVAMSTGGLSDLNASISELFIKLFLVPTIFCIISLYLLNLIWENKEIEQHNLNEYSYLVGGTAALSLFFVVALGVGRLNPFRQLVVIFVVVTIMASISITKLSKRYYSTIGTSRTKLITVLILLVLVLASIPTLHASPFIYRASSNSPESYFTGYETQFEYWGGETHFSEVSSVGSRYKHALKGTEQSQETNISGVPYSLPRYSRVPDHFANRSLEKEYPDGQIIAISSKDRKKYIDMYGGYRYRKSDFKWLNQTESVNRIYSNSGIDFYYVS